MANMYILITFCVYYNTCFLVHSWTDDMLCGLVPANRLKRSEARIFNGTVAHLGKHPWMVFLKIGESGRAFETCSAAIIKADWLITAAHCFDE